MQTRLHGFDLVLYRVFDDMSRPLASVTLDGMRLHVMRSIRRAFASTPARSVAPHDRQLVAEALDRDYYLSRYPDVAAAGRDPVEHYMVYGWREGRDPAPWFSGRAYLADHADVRARGIDPFLHYLRLGRAEGRRATSVADGESRLANELAKKVTSLASLPGFRGVEMCRVLAFLRRLTAARPSELCSFDSVAYLLLNPDIAMSRYRASPTRHFDRFGSREHRLCRPADVLDIYFGASKPSTPEFTALARSYLRECRLHPRKDPIDSAILALGAAGGPKRRGHSHGSLTSGARAFHGAVAGAQEIVNLRPTFGKVSVAEKPSLESLRTVTVACHLYYMDELDWIKSVCARFAGLDGLRLRYVFSLSEAKATAAAVDAIRHGFPSAAIYLTENRGHDLGALLSILRAESFRGSEWLVTLHGKKSSQNDPAIVAGWKQALADSIVAGLEDLDRCCKAGNAAELAGRGGYFAKSWQRKNMGRNAAAVQALRRSFLPAATPSDKVTYLSGSMMVTRMSVWREIAELSRDCTFSDTGKLSAEARTDGLLEHGVERIVQELAQHRGLECVWN